MNATTVQNVVTYNAIIDFANPELKLFPGMTAFVTVPVATAQNVLKVPNSALRYRPPLSVEEIRRAYARFGIDTAGAAPMATPASDTQAHPTVASRQTVAAAHHDPDVLLENAVVWKRDSDGALSRHQLALGITDHAYTEASASPKAPSAPARM